jgi:signal peptidase I
MTLLVATLIVIALIAAVFVAGRLGFQVVKVIGGSMEPTFSSGDIVLATTWWPRRWLQRGAVVLIRGYGGVEPLRTALMIKRIGNLDGDHVHFWVRGKAEEQQVIVERDHVFVLSDAVVSHRNDRGAITEPGIQTIDSRIWGPIPVSSIVGRVLMKVPQSRASRTDE